MHEGPSGRPENAKESDFNELSDTSVLALSMSQDISPEDRANAEAELIRRDEMGAPDREGDDNLERDLALNDYFIENGEVYYPTDEVKEFRKKNLEGPIPKELYETLKDRAKKATDAVIREPDGLIITGSENEKISATPEEKARLVIENTERITPNEYASVPGFNPWLIRECNDAVREREGDFNLNNNRGQSIFEVASEPLIAYILDGTGKTDKLFPGVATTARWASKFDDIKRKTDIVYCVKDTSKNKLGWITYSIDITTAITDDKSDRTGVAGKFSDATYPDSSALKNIHKKDRIPVPWTNEIVFCKSGKYKYSEEYAPHFVLGLSRESFSQIFSEMTIDKTGAILDCPLSDEVEFMITSEFFEEINMQRANITDKDKDSVYAKQIAVLRKMVMTKLNNLLGVEPGDSVTLKEKYTEKLTEMAEKDPVYALIVAHSKKQKKAYQDINGK